MNIQEYISSGILELYVTGAASPDERKEVERYALEYPEIKAELDAIEDALNLYATSNGVQPPSHLKNKILGDVAGKTSDIGESENTIVRSLNINSASKTSNYFYLAIAASVLVLISVGSFFLTRSDSDSVRKYQIQEGMLSLIQKKDSILNDSLATLTASYKQAMNDMAILKDPAYKMVELKGLKPAPDAKVMVCWSASKKKVYIEVDKLPATPKGMQYQLWAIVDGKPVSEGMLGPGGGLHHMPDVENAQAFAITLEKEGGSTTPTMDAMYVMGTT